MIIAPIDVWPGEQTRNRRRHPFRKQNSRGWMESSVNWSGTMDLLERELKQLQAQNVVLQMAVTDRDIRNDGWIRANANPAHPGVILAFESKFGPLKYPCDTFTDWRANVRGIALALEALRKVDRYGVTKRGEQYTGWKRLPARAANGPAAILAEHSGMTRAEVEASPRKAFLLASKSTHPDQGGDADAFSEVVDAARILGVK